jgi:hypothetical protein
MILAIGWLHDGGETVGTWLHQAGDWQEPKAARSESPPEGAERPIWRGSPREPQASPGVGRQLTKMKLGSERDWLGEGRLSSRTRRRAF